MLVKIISDLHFHPMKNDFKYVDHGERVCILAGDIAEGMRGVNWAEVNIPNHIDVLYVPGNHEYYGYEYHQLNAKYRAFNQLGSNVRVLLNEAVEVYDKRFVGSTLWTDFQAYNNPLSELHWKEGLNDSAWIKYGDRNISARDIKALNEEALKFLSNQQGDVLITHYAPISSEHPYWRGHKCTPGFITHIPEYIHGSFNVHVHGHTHNHFDYMTLYGTRVICNTRGYYGENVGFNEELVINI